MYCNKPIPNNKTIHFISSRSYRYNTPNHTTIHFLQHIPNHKTIYFIQNNNKPIPNHIEICSSYNKPIPNNKKKHSLQQTHTKLLNNTFLTKNHTKSPNNTFFTTNQYQTTKQYISYNICRIFIHKTINFYEKKTKCNKVYIFNPKAINLH